MVLGCVCTCYTDRGVIVFCGKSLKTFKVEIQFSGILVAS